MGRVLGAFLLVLFAGGSTVSDPPAVERQPPWEWFQVELGSVEPRFAEPNQAGPRRLGWSGAPVTLNAYFRNAGEQTLPRPTVRFAFAVQAMPEAVLVDADGDGWSCRVSDLTATCRAETYVAPGEVRAPIRVDIERDPVSTAGAPDRGHTFTVTFDDVVYESYVDWTAST
ncbi:hypothetical protein ACFWNN_24675 [Lentzea sp. NPDC058450]|uniref:hypothetical protein n=1 Tax=Lentzea sp. NPDC058450 TaxID=3346505 RepID=UPI0036699A82